MTGKNFKCIFGEGEILRFDSQIRQAFHIMDSNNIPLSYRGLTQAMKNQILQLGFEYAHSSGHTFIGKRQVIKLGLFTTNPPEPKYRVPTVIYGRKKIRYFDYDFCIAIQPRVNKFVDWTEEDNFMDYFENRTRTDCHSGNFGYHNGKVKLFDW